MMPLIFEFESDSQTGGTDLCAKLEVHVFYKNEDVTDLKIYNTDKGFAPVQFCDLFTYEQVKIVDLAKYHVDMENQKPKEPDEDFYFELARDLALTMDETK